MSRKLLFAHGTGVRDVSPAMAQIRRGLANVLQWDAADVIPIEWGLKVGPPDIDVGPSLPAEHATRAAVLSPTAPEDVDAVVALWQLLLLDPMAELRVAAEAGDGAAQPGIGAPGVESPSVAFVRRVAELELPAETLERSGFSAEQLHVAARVVAGDPVLAAAADRGTDGLNAPTARAIVATATVGFLVARDRRDREQAGPPAVFDGAARDALTEAVAVALTPQGEKLALFPKKLVAKLATRVAVGKRADFMDPFSDFLRDVTYYLQHGEQLRAVLADAVRAAAADAGDGPVVLLGHSLGGVAAVDLLADPAVMDGPDALKVDLLVTVGSQAPILYLMDSLASLSPKGDRLPFAPWLNIYNRDDLLSFCAERVWPARVKPQILDVAVDAGVPFPMSHSAYWGQRKTYESIKDRLG